MKFEIPIPEGYKIATFDQSTGKGEFLEIPKSIMQRIKTVDDVLAEWDIDKKEFDEIYKGFMEDEKAYKLIKLLVKTLNEGWEPNWDDGDQCKYFPYFYMGGSSGFRFHDCGAWRSSSVVGSLLCFKSHELAEYAGKQFADLYKEFMIINYNATCKS